MAGKGHAGVRGGAPGDLLIDVSVAEHPVFRRDGDDVHMVVPMRSTKPGLGARIDIATPDGGARCACRPARSRASGSGCASAACRAETAPRGDLVVEVRLTLPQMLDERSKELLREFGRINGESVREQ